MKRMLWLMAAAGIAACGDNTGVGGVPNAQLNIIVQDTLAPPLLATRDSFWAKVQDGREMKLFYQGAQPGDSGEEFLRFEVPGDGLYRKPDGTPFQVGDSILITVTVVDPARFLFDFDPDGLQFSPDHPARLRVRYLNSDKDFNDDGAEDSSDVRIEGELDLWHRSGPTALWFPLGAVKFEDLDEIDANIRSFSQFAVAW
jgi:hypothetical protein